jgi:hypothetical protein
MIPEPCNELRREFESLDALPGVDAQVHLQGCAECRGWIAQRSRIEGALRTLTRLPAPCALTDAVTGWLERERTLSELSRQSPPAVLKRLVDEEVQEGATALCERTLRGLPRHGAPAELEALVARQLVAPRRQPAPAGLARASSPQRAALAAPQRAPWIAAAAALLLIVTWQQGADEGGDQRPAPRRTLVLVSTPQAVSGLSASLAYGLGGGAVARPSGPGTPVRGDQ